MRAIAQTAMAAGFFCWVVFELAILSCAPRKQINVGASNVRLGSKRTFPRAHSMSGFGGIAEIGRTLKVKRLRRFLWPLVPGSRADRN
jgi:hypothetical protein